MNDQQQAILTAARAHVEALAHLRTLRTRRRDRRRDGVEFLAYGQDKTFWAYFDEEIKQARAARKRTLARLKRAVAQAGPLPGQRSLFEEVTAR